MKGRAIDLDQIPPDIKIFRAKMSWDLMQGRFQRRMEERIAEIRHRLAMEEACNGTAISGAANVPGFLEMEEELLGEAAELERILAAGESGASTT